MRIAVVGGTGLVGRLVVDAFATTDVDVVAVSRRTGVDVTTGDGLDVAFTRVDRVIDVTNAGSTDEATATAFFTTAAGHIQAAADRAGADRIVLLSIVGIDRVASGYYAAKLAHEQATQAGPVPAVVLRSTQFHEFAGQVLTWNRVGEVSRVPEMLVQPVAAETVAAELVELALAASPPATSDVGGPLVEELVDLATKLAARRGDPRRVEGYRDDNERAELLATGALLPGRDGRLLGPTFDEWLDAGERLPHLPY
jgi:uncharacterized protein YbjT (DUF2867 family)